MTPKGSMSAQCLLSCGLDIELSFDIHEKSRAGGQISGLRKENRPFFHIRNTHGKKTRICASPPPPELF
jgi:hypothetical protein